MKPEQLSRFGIHDPSLRGNGRKGCRVGVGGDHVERLIDVNPIHVVVEPEGDENARNGTSSLPLQPSLMNGADVHVALEVLDADLVDGEEYAGEDGRGVLGRDRDRKTNGV